MPSLFVQELVLKSRLDELTTLSQWVEQLSSQLGLSPRGAFRLELVLTEAVTNVIENAYEDDQEHEITITLHYQDHTATVHLIDDGLPFDPLQQPEVVLPTSLDEATAGGLGIHLIRRYTDDSQYQRVGHENILTMTIRDTE